MCQQLVIDHAERNQSKEIYQQLQIRNSLTSQEVVDFVCDRLKDRVKDGRPTPDVLTQICESVSYALRKVKDVRESYSGVCLVEEL